MVWWKCRWIVPIGTDRDDPSHWWPMVTVRDCLLVFDWLRKYSLRCNGVRGNVGGSSRSGRIVTTRHIVDGWWLFVTVCLFSIDLENIYGSVMVCEEMSANPLDRDNVCPSQRWRMVTVRDCLSVVDCDREYSLRCIGVRGNVGGSLQFFLNWTDRFYSIKMRGLVFCDLVSVCCGFRKYSLRSMVCDVNVFTGYYE